MTSSEERREVAERLRDDNPGYGTEYDFFLHALGLSREGRGPCDWAKVHKRLADLIDPTCQEVPMESVGRWPFYTGIDLHLEMVSYGCSVCGYPWGEIDKWATHGAGWHNSPKYCPNCGRRVVKDMMK